MATIRSKKTSLQTKKNLWELAASIAQHSALPQTQHQSRHVIVVGDAQSGKSTLISTFLNPNKDSTPKPTIAIDYSFARKVNSQTGQKEVVRIWEIGGDFDSELVRVPLSSKNLASSGIVIVCDLSKPASIVRSLQSKLATLRQICEEHLRQLQHSNPVAHEECMSKQQSLALADDHVDKYHTRAFPVPVIIVATRYDEFKDVESAKRRALLQAIRFVAHLNGASFVCSSNSEKAARDLARAQVAAMSFTTQLRPVFQTDIEKPVAVQWGRDSFEKILQHTLPGVDVAELQRGPGSAGHLVGALSRAVNEVYGIRDDHESKGREDEVELENQDDSEELLRFADPIIDEARAQKALELAQFRELQARYRRQKLSSKAT